MNLTIYIYVCIPKLSTIQSHFSTLPTYILLQPPLTYVHLPKNTCYVNNQKNPFSIYKQSILPFTKIFSPHLTYHNVTDITTFFLHKPMNLTIYIYVCIPKLSTIPSHFSTLLTYILSQPPLVKLQTFMTDSKRKYTTYIRTYTTPAENYSLQHDNSLISHPYVKHSFYLPVPIPYRTILLPIYPFYTNPPKSKYPHIR